MIYVNVHFRTYQKQCYKILAPNEDVCFSGAQYFRHYKLLTTGDASVLLYNVALVDCVGNAGTSKNESIHRTFKRFVMQQSPINLYTFLQKIDFIHGYVVFCQMLWWLTEADAFYYKQQGFPRNTWDDLQSWLDSWVLEFKTPPVFAPAKGQGKQPIFHFTQQGADRIAHEMTQKKIASLDLISRANKLWDWSKSRSLAAYLMTNRVTSLTSTHYDAIWNIMSMPNLSTEEQEKLREAILKRCAGHAVYEPQ